MSRRQSFAQTRLSATRMLHFVEERQQCVRRLVLMNSEGYWSGEGWKQAYKPAAAQSPAHPWRQHAAHLKSLHMRH